MFFSGRHYIRICRQLNIRVCHRQHPPETLQEHTCARVEQHSTSICPMIDWFIGSTRLRCEAVFAARGGYTRNNVCFDPHKALSLFYIISSL